MNMTQNMNENTKETNASFVQELASFHSSRGTTLKIPKFNRQPLDLTKLWNAVRKHGGSSKVSQMKNWAQIGRIFGGTTADKNVSNNIKRAFSKWLLPYEKAVCPNEAMSSSEEKAYNASSSASPGKRERRRSGSFTVEKKPRSSYASTQYEEECNEQGELTTISSPQMSSMQAPHSLPCSASIALPHQRSYVSFPNSNESKFCIILLPSSNAEDISSGSLSGTRVSLDQNHSNEACHRDIPVTERESKGIRQQDNDLATESRCDQSQRTAKDVLSNGNIHHSSLRMDDELKKCCQREAFDFTRQASTFTVKRNGMVKRDMINNGSSIESEAREHSISSISVNAARSQPPLNVGGKLSGLLCLLDNNNNNARIEKKG